MDDLHLLNVYLQSNHMIAEPSTLGGAPSSFVCHHWGMAGKKMDLGPTGGTVAGNLTRLREGAGLTYTEVSRLLTEVGRDVSPLGVRRIEDGTRRVDVDDLMALSVALNVNPNALLLPHYSGDVEIGHELTAVPDTVTGEGAWAWADGWQALPHSRADAPEVDESLTGMAKGRALAAKHSAEDGRGFLERVRPDGEDAGARQFLATVSETVGELESSDWLSLWFHSDNPERFDGKRNGPIGARVAAYPEGGWSDVSKYFERIKAELAGIIGSDTARPFLDEVLRNRKVPNGDD
jgi:transcriptional regulator with XRE-family HTH domain